MGEKTTVWTNNTLTKASITESSIQLLSYSSVSLVCVRAHVDVYMHYHTAGKADTSEAWRDVLPDTDAALTNILTRSQLHEKQRNSNQQQQHHIQQQERPCK